MKFKDHGILIKKIRKIENEADTCYRKGIKELFSNGHAPMEVIKQRELLEISEEAIDEITDIAELWEQIVINHV